MGQTGGTDGRTERGGRTASPSNRRKAPALSASGPVTGLCRSRFGKGDGRTIQSLRRALIKDPTGKASRVCINVIFDAIPAFLHAYQDESQLPDATEMHVGPQPSLKDHAAVKGIAAMTGFRGS
jgi:hypothetical protein